ncbi:MAG TPA: ATP-dependent RNA helicase [Clostridiales bacterium]|nr:ATP-dependent RNA helicase [Clostridiales bacterium]
MIEDIKSFKDFGLSEKILAAVDDMGFEEPTRIQSQTIPLIMEGKDITGHSQTGTGKTAAFALPALEMIDTNINKVQVLILCPTRELAIQGSDEVKKFSKYLPDIKAVPIYGGQSMEQQFKALRQGVHIVIGTPGRVMDHMRRKTLKLDQVRLVVLDEADEMLNIGFREDMEIILQETPEARQTVLFSATMPAEILRISKEYQKSPVSVSVVHKQLTVPNITQYYLETTKSKKTELLCRLIDIYTPQLSLVFCNTKKMVDEVTSQLQSRGYFADALHGDLRQSVRSKIIEAFRKGKTEILVATDVAARGLDIEHVEAVFNYDLPQDDEYYVHRIGRTGRAGKTGKSFTFINGRGQMYAIKNLQKFTNTKIAPHPIPTLQEIEENKTNRFFNELSGIIENDEHLKHMNAIETFMEKYDYSAMEVGAALMKMLQKDKVVNEEIDMEDFEDTGAEPGMVRLFMNVGKKDKVKPQNIVGAIANEAGIKGTMVGAIDIYDKFTFVEVPKDQAKHVIDAINNTKIKGRAVNAEPAKKR